MGKVKEERRVVFAFNDEEVEQMREYLREHQQPKYLFMFNFAVKVGLRVSDIVPLKVKHVRGKDSFRIIEQKTGKDRTVYIPKKLEKEIEEYTEGKKGDDWLFPSRQGGGHIKRVRVYQVFNEAGKSIGHRYTVGVHTLRRTFGTMVYKKTNHDVKRVQELLNHSSLSATIRYLGVREKENEDFMRDFDF